MKTDITVVLDRSGSMEPIADDVVEGLNTFVRRQQEIEGEAWLTLVQFDDEYQIVHFHAPIVEVPPLTRQTYQPRGTTALLDAIGRTIVDIDLRVGRLAAAARPDQIVVAVQTDGLENASREFTRREVFRMIREREQRVTTASGASPSWEFVFLAANQDAIAEGGRLGFQATKAVDFDADGGSVHEVYRVMHEKLAVKRRAPGASMDFTASDRARTRRTR